MLALLLLSTIITVYNRVAQVVQMMLKRHDDVI